MLRTPLSGGSGCGGRVMPDTCLMAAGRRTTHSKILGDGPMTVGLLDSGSRHVSRDSVKIDLFI